LTKAISLWRTKFLRWTGKAKYAIQVVITIDESQIETQHIACVEREDLTPTTLRLTLAEGKTILKALQAVVVEQQMTAYLETQRSCAHCGHLQRSKGSHTTQVRTVFGTISVKSPRLYQCPCQPHPTETYSPLAALLPEHLTPELLFLETKWAALVSYGITAQLLEDVLPIDDTLAPCTMRGHVFKVAERLEQALGEEQWSFIDSCPAEWSHLPIPNGPLTVGIDGGYVRAQPKQGWFEVIAGKSLLAFTRGEESEQPVSSKSFAFVQTYDQKPKRRLFEVLQSQGHQLNQQITFLSDGGDTVRDLQLYLNPHAEHLLDWFHVAMRLTVLQQTAKGLPHQIRDEEQDYPLRDPVIRNLERLKWFLWHGNVYKALQVVQSVEMDLDDAVATSGHATARKLLKTVEEFHIYIKNNGGFIPNYGERYRAGERISTGFVESTVNQVISKRFCKKQQTAWTPRGAHLLLQPHAGVKWRLGGDLPRVVSGVPCGSSADGGVTPQNQTLSIFGDARTERVIRTVTPVAPIPWGRERGGR
jgi:hypothetical protein